MIFLKSILGAVAGGVAMLMLCMLQENIAQIRRGDIVGKYQAFGMIVAPLVILAVCIIIIATIVFQR